MEKVAVEIIKKLHAHNYKAYLAGGYVRDKLLNRVSTSDIDIATSALPDQILKLFSESKYVGEAFGVVLVTVDGHSFEVATFRRDMGITDGRHPDKVEFTTDVIKDAFRRDFTINALYYDPLKNNFLDFVNGMSDIRNRKIKFVGNAKERINEDYLRILRAIRFSSRLGFDIDRISSVAISQNAENVKKLASERVFDELNKIFKTSDVGKSFDLLLGYGILKHIIPEVTSLWNSEEPKEFHPEGDTLTHTKQVMQNIPFGAPLHLTYAAMLHDVGKPKTKGFHKGRITYYGHDKVGVDLAKDILIRLRSDNKLIDNVSYLIGQHMAFRNVQNMKKSTLKKLVSHPLFYDLLQLHYADCMGSRKDLKNYNFIIRKLSEINLEEIKKEVNTRLITGEDLKNLGIKPGPIYKEILEDIHTKCLDGWFETRDKKEMLEYVKNYMNIPGRKPYIPLFPVAQYVHNLDELRKDNGG
jgi:tRNA nucleotidyltransferase/poly(A) polymerase